ncbi:Spermidine/spermine N(1)-acetyltransferase [Sporomusa rhizae]|uniref:GNAT family N-acetyltransferase n=1 Tax=Sporomusa rhizae TaxID=357999 RepID=UPI00352B547D
MILKCTLGELSALQKIAYKTYKETFACMNTEANMNAYLEEAFSLDKLRHELLNEASLFYFIYQDNKLAGYLKLNECKAQTDIYDHLSLEVERIYVLSEFQGKGLGRYLMDKAIAVAQERKKTYMWLGVWEKNKNALEFYKKNSFYEIGTHAFVMGDDVQKDYLLRKDL